MERFRLIHLSQTGVFDNLQLVYLQHIKRQRGYDGGLSERFVGILARQSENDMSADIDSSFSRLFDDASCTLEVVPPVDSPQRIVVGRFDTIFYRQRVLQREHRLWRGRDQQRRQHAQYWTWTKENSD